MLSMSCYELMVLL